MRHHIQIKSPAEIEILRQGGKILSDIVKELTRSLKIGMTTAQVDVLSEKLMARQHVQPAFKGYRGFPASSCLSVNEQVVHGIPGERVLNDGDIVSIDVGIIHEEYYCDTAITVGVGKIGPKLQKLLNVTREALYKGITQAKADNHLSDISFAIQSYVESHHFSVVRDFVGHGIGRALHEEPEIPNFGLPHRGPVLKPGMALAIEPMVNMGSWQIKVGEDAWTVETLDGKPSAHFEHTIIVAENGPEILTK